MNKLSDKEQLDLLKRTLDALPRGVLITDFQQKDDPIVYANEFFLKMSGYNYGEIIGRNCRFMQGDETEPEELKKLAIALRNHEPVNVKMVNYRKNGEKFINQFSISPVKNDKGEVTHCVALEKEL